MLDEKKFFSYILCKNYEEYYFLYTQLTEPAAGRLSMVLVSE